MGKFIVANTIGVLLLGLLWAAGLLGAVLDSPALPAIGILCCFVGVALGLIAFKQYPWARWISDKMTLFGLAGTVTGAINAFTHAQFSGDAITVMSALALGLGLALFSTLTGIIGHAWLDWNLALQLGPESQK